MNVYIGLDVSLASTAICVLGPQGKIVEELQADSEPEALVHAVGLLPYTIDAIGLEAGPLSQWLSKGIEEAGFEVVLMETRLVKAALKAMPIKTDRRDACQSALNFDPLSASNVDPLELSRPGAA